jgi:primase-polymerase (primpol)-like protein
MIPGALKEIAPDPRWIVWKWAQRRNKDSKVKPTKPPLMIKYHRPSGYAHNDKPETWSSPTDAMQAAQYADGEGLRLLGLSGEAAPDLEDVRDEAGALLPWAYDLIRRAQTYAEFTPSGRGARILGRVPVGHEAIHTKIEHPNGGHFEVYANLTEGSSRYSQAAHGFERRP